MSNSIPDSHTGKSSSRERRHVASVLDDNPHRFKGAFEAAQAWARKHRDPCAPRPRTQYKRKSLSPHDPQHIG